MKKSLKSDGYNTACQLRLALWSQHVYAVYMPEMSTEILVGRI